MNNFLDEIDSFLISIGADYLKFADFTPKSKLPLNGVVNFYFPKQFINIYAVPLNFFKNSENNDLLKFFRVESDSGKSIFVYEDCWWRIGKVVRDRIIANISCQKMVFARNCEVRPIDSSLSSRFLEKYHSYGSTIAKYKYGLFRCRTTGEREIAMTQTNSLIAVATFSEGRDFERDGVIIRSYEWVRYASVSDCRVIGGMGKVLNTFIRDCSPDEIMSYADIEWSDGSVYRKLGFEFSQIKPPLTFFVDSKTMERISSIKFGRDNQYKGLKIEDSITISNLGSVKYILRLKKNR